jgi:uncharacterized protein (DUF2384 family)
VEVMKYKAHDSEPLMVSDVTLPIYGSSILNYLIAKDISHHHLNTLRAMSNFKDDEMADWLNISVRTFRDYRKPGVTYKENLKEHILILLSLFKHGHDVFGGRESFDAWLNTENFFLFGKKPAAFLNTITGIRHIDDRLTALEYGDNV